MAITAEYVSSTEFDVSGDYAVEYPQGRKILLVQGVDGNLIATVATASYNSGTNKTRVTIATTTTTTTTTSTTSTTTTSTTT